MRNSSPWVWAKALTTSQVAEHLLIVCVCDGDWTMNILYLRREYRRYTLILWISFMSATRTESLTHYTYTHTSTCINGGSSWVRQTASSSQFIVSHSNNNNSVILKRYTRTHRERKKKHIEQRMLVIVSSLSTSRVLRCGLLHLTGKKNH